jgi:acetolactate synthase-1/2/3 large subunit
MFIKDVVSLWLQKLHVKKIFGIPGSYVLPLIDSTTRHNIPFTLSQHEYGAALMADGYTKACGEVSCVITTTGIGATNALSGIYNSFSDSQPVIFITGQVPTTLFGKGVLQECVGIGRTIHIEELFASVTKYSKMVTSANELLLVLQEAEFHLMEGRKGPIHLCIPIDILQTEITFMEFLPSLDIQAPATQQDVYEKLQGLLEQSIKPLLLLGAGCQTEESAALATQLADRGLPIATTLRGKGILDEMHPVSLGCIGMYGESAANYYLDRQADLIIAIGVSMSEFTTQCWDNSFLKSKLVQVDIDLSQIGKNYPVELGFHSDATGFLYRLVQLPFLRNETLEKASRAVISSKEKFVQASPEASQGKKNKLLQQR